ncbi:MAG: hypothetical protein JNM75_05925 [Rhodospirillales bacterium]|nr:hypothetical protein [Rhodospirillales bacterium]
MVKISPLEQSVRSGCLPRLLILGALPPGDWHPLSWRLVLDPDAEFDAIVLGEGTGADEARTIVERSRVPLAPIVDVSPTPVAHAEVRVGVAGLASVGDVLAEAAEIVRRVEALPEPVRRASDPALLLLARCATRKTGLAAVLSAAVPDLVHYPAAGHITAPRRHAERLADAGLLARTFFDRLHVCPRCRSARLCVREECSACRGADIDEEPTVHHFACAHMALERAFRSGDLLVCPKCRRSLRHFGVDYAKPGMATVCNGCGHVDGEPVIGFRCVDCGAHHDARAVSTCDWYSYALTAAGEDAIARGALDPAIAPPPPARETLLFLLRQGLALEGHGRRGPALIELALQALPAVAAGQGARFAERARALAVEAVRGELREIDLVVGRDNGAIIYLPETAADAAKAAAERIVRRVRAVVAVELDPDARLVDPRVLLGDLEAAR